MSPTIRATDLYAYIACDRLVYLDHNGDSSRKLPRTSFDEFIAKRGDQFEGELVSQFEDLNEPGYESGDFQAGFKATIALMRAGAPLIYQAVLMREDMIGLPDLLEKVPGESAFGPFHYRPVDIKLATSSRKDQQLQVMAYIWQLEGIQGRRPEGALYLRLPPEEASPDIPFAGDVVIFDEPLFYQSLTAVRDLAAGRQEPRPFISATCKSCGWREICRPIARRNRDVSLISGMKRSVWEELHLRNLGSLSALAEAHPSSIGNIKGVAGRTAVTLINAAKAMTTDQPIIIMKPDLPHPAPTDVFFDIESVPFDRVYYLMGMLMGNDETARFVYEVAARPHEEGMMWDRFLERMDRLGGIVYHYGSYETTSIRKLIERYGLDPRAEALYDRLIDLEKVLKASVVLPLEGYSLKDIAPWLGFSWSVDDYKADDSMISYLEFQADGDHAHLNNILTYNQDDLKATRMIRDWLLTLEG